jgi:hypothetical protein
VMVEENIIAFRIFGCIQSVVCIKYVNRLKIAIREISVLVSSYTVAFPIFHRIIPQIQ